MKRIRPLLLLALVSFFCSAGLKAQKTPFYKDWGGSISLGGNNYSIPIAYVAAVLDLKPQNAPYGAFHRAYLGPMMLRLDGIYEEKFYPGFHLGYNFFPNTFGQKARFYFGVEMDMAGASIKKDGLFQNFLICEGDFESASFFSVDTHLALGMQFPLGKYFYLSANMGLGVQIEKNLETWICRSDGSEIIIGSASPASNASFFGRGGIGFTIPDKPAER